MNKFDDQLRSFGMSGFMITEDFRRLEQKYEINLVILLPLYLSTQ